MNMTPFEKASLEIELIKIKLDILKLKADDYQWQCNTPDSVRTELEKMLQYVDEVLKAVE